MYLARLPRCGSDTLNREINVPIYFVLMRVLEQTPYIYLSIMFYHVKYVCIYIYTVPTGADPRPWIHATTAYLDCIYMQQLRGAIIQLFFCLTWSQLLAAMDASQHRKPWSATTVCRHLNMPIEMSSWLAAHYLHLATSKVQPSSER